MRYKEVQFSTVIIINANILNSLLAELKSSSIQLISAIVGSGLVVFAITTLYTDWFNKPDVHIEVEQPTYHDLHVDVRNIGRVPATNLKLIVNTSQDMINPIVFTTENHSISGSENLTKTLLLNSRLLEVYIPRLTHGTGSIVRITGEVANSTDLFYNIYATYDQGSTRKSNQQESYNFPFDLTLAISIAAAITFAIPYAHRKIRKWRRKKVKKFVSEIAEDVLSGTSDPIQ